jgi:UDP-glucose 4-epimerase
MHETVLITGGLGYLGSRIAHSLLLMNKFKIILGTRNNKIDLPKKLIGCQIVAIDLLDSINIKTNLLGVDTIIHLAAMNADDCKKDPSNALLVNGLGTLNLVQSAQDSSVKKIIYFSSAHVYGSPMLGNITEDIREKPSNYYSITHRIAEDFIIKAGKEGTLNTCVLRLTNAIGFPINKYSNCWMLVANDFAKQIVETKKIHINSSGTQLRDFIPITNVTSAVKLLLKKSLNGEILNLGSGVSLSILDLAKLLSIRAKEILNIDTRITKDGDKLNSKESFSFKIDKVLSMGYSPVCTLEDEIDNLLISVSKEFGIKDSSKK